MVSIWRSPIIRNVVIALILIPAVGMAADFGLLWDPNCNEDADLTGYVIYYVEEKSVVLNPGDASEIYVPLTQNGFSPDDPRYLVSGLIDDMPYCFAVSAWYGNAESSMSNEICGMNGVPIPHPDGGSTQNSNSGCFIDALK